MKKNFRYDKYALCSSSSLYLIKIVVVVVTFAGVLFSGCSDNTKGTESDKDTSGKDSVIYTCPMHPEVQKNVPGDCPKCGMPLEKTESEKIVYWCPMHPEVQQDKPGECAKCGGMKLVIKDPANYLEAVLKPVSSHVLSKVQIIKPEFKARPIEVEALGYFDYDNYGKYDLSSRYSGRIEKLNIKFNYQPIKKGDVAFEVYSPDLVTAQENLVYLLKSSPEETELINATKKKLELLQLTPAQIEEIVKTKKVGTSIAVYSKYDGHVHEVGDADMQKMGDYSKSPLLSVKEGMYVERGQVLFNIFDPHRVVAMLKVKQSDISKIQLQNKVTFTVNGDSNIVMHGLVDFIEPVYAENAKNIMVRVNIDNKDHQHKIGSLINARINSESFETLWIPSSSFVDLGKSKIVWRWKDGVFKAQKIETGMRVNDWIEVADGLTASDEIAAEAHFLSDSEGFINAEDND